MLLVEWMKKTGATVDQIPTNWFTRWLYRKSYNPDALVTGRKAGEVIQPVVCPHCNWIFKTADENTDVIEDDPIDRCVWLYVTCPACRDTFEPWSCDQ